MDYFTRNWELYSGTSINTNALVKTIPDSDVFKTAKRELRAGLYLLRITAQLHSHYFDLTNMDSVVMLYFDIVPTPLQIGVEGGPYLESPFNQTISIDAFNLTFDPDINTPEDKSGFSLRWLCKQQTELWPSTLPSVPYKSFQGSINGGCFGDGPGVVTSFNTLSFTLDTSNMRPLTNYSLRLEVSKDTRTASYDLLLYVDYADAPVLSIK